MKVDLAALQRIFAASPFVADVAAPATLASKLHRVSLPRRAGRVTRQVVDLSLAASWFLVLSVTIAAAAGAILSAVLPQPAGDLQLAGGGIPSRQAASDPAEPSYVALETLPFDDDASSQVTMSVIEAGTNAIQHGHKRDATRPVDIEYRLMPDMLEITVHDTGPGFDPTVINGDITSPEHLLDARGRGIFIMKSCMDSVEFTFGPSGTLCRLVKNRPGKADNAFRRGRYIDFANKQSFSDMLVTCHQYMGFTDVTSFGDARLASGLGALAGLT